MNKKPLLVLVLCVFFLDLKAQTGILKGRVSNFFTNESIPFANVTLLPINKTVQTDENGLYEFTNLAAGLYNVEVMYVGFIKKNQYEIQVSNAFPVVVDITLEEETKELKEVIIKNSPFNKTDESPLSLRTIGASEIERYPGGNRDISKVIQSLPGVASTPSFRNDIIIRGGAPNENRFYLDGIEIPNINHFATQGASGGPVGMINVNLIKGVDLLSGAFPASRGNAMSSVFEFKMKDGRKDKFSTQTTIGASDLAFSTEGPLTKKTSMIVSVRRSYLQFLFKALKLPFLPTYNDFYVKTKTAISPKLELTYLGIGAIDDFRLNKSAAETSDQETRDRNLYILGNIPVNTQWNYSNGFKLRHYHKKGYSDYIVSRNMLTNESTKYENNDESLPLILKYKSQEIENKVRVENVSKKGNWNITNGAGYEYVKYNNATYNRLSLPSATGITIPIVIDFNSALEFHKYSLFSQVSRSLLQNRLTLSGGIRLDGNSYSSKMSNPLEQLSPRISASYSLTSKLNVNMNTGVYYQLPAYTILGYRSNEGNLVNQNQVKPIQCQHLVGGIEYNTDKNAKFTVEGFVKQYNYYPLSNKTGISLANQGGDFGVIGNESVNSDSKGQAYGIEVLMQQKLYKNFFGIVAYTWVRSSFSNANNELKPSAWDSRHIISLTGGYKFKRNWDLGARWRFSGGQPYTPFDVNASSSRSNWDITGRGISDYSRLNTNRLPVFHQLDLRVDKKYYFAKVNLNFYLDIQNFYNFQAETAPFLTVERDKSGNALVNPENPDQYLTKSVANKSGRLLPTIGVIIEF